MIALFTERSLEDIRQSIHQTLIDTFKVMFQLDVVVDPESKTIQPDQLVRSTIEMKHAEMNIRLSLATTRVVAGLICDRFDPETKIHSNEMIADIISEITNIISNQLRTNIELKHHILFDVSLPQQGIPDHTPHGTQAFNIFFTIGTMHEFNMNMTHTSADGLTQVIG